MRAQRATATPCQQQRTLCNMLLEARLAAGLPVEIDLTVSGRNESELGELTRRMVSGLHNDASVKETDARIKVSIEVDLVEGHGSIRLPNTSDF